MLILMFKSVVSESSRCKCLCFFLQSIIQKKTNIRRQRREIFLQDHRQKQAQAAEMARQQERDSQPLKPVENSPSISRASQPPQSSPIRSPVQKSEGVTVAFGRTTKIQHQRSPSAGKGIVRRHSLENDNVSLPSVR